MEPRKGEFLQFHFFGRAEPEVRWAISVLIHIVDVKIPSAPICRVHAQDLRLRGRDLPGHRASSFWKHVRTRSRAAFCSTSACEMDGLSEVQQALAERGVAMLSWS